jgi:short-subunit dehydrogenase
MPGLTDYRGRVAIVTGASSGIGAQLARDLAGRGMRVALVARRADRLQTLAGELGRAGSDTMVAAADVADRAAVERTVAAVHERWRRIDLLVNNAGIGAHVLFRNQDVAEIEHMLRVNVLGVVYATKAVLPTMIAQRAGWVVNVSSIAGKLGQPDEAVYSATKFAVSGLSEGLGYELAPLGIHVMAVHPGLIDTEMLTPEVMARMPRGAARSMIPASAFTAELLRALERGRRDVTIPRYMGLGAVMRLLLPGFYRRMTARIRLSVLPDVGRA